MFSMATNVAKLVVTGKRFPDFLLSALLTSPTANKTLDEMVGESNGERVDVHDVLNDFFHNLQNLLIVNTYQAYTIVTVQR